jgi:hypothetical protein
VQPEPPTLSAPVLVGPAAVTVDPNLEEVFGVGRGCRVPRGSVVRARKGPYCVHYRPGPTQGMSNDD